VIRGTLHSAAALNDLTALRNLLHFAAPESSSSSESSSPSINVNEEDSEGRYPLHLAARNGSVEGVEELLKAGAKIDAIDTDLQTAAHVAARRGNAELLKVLCSNQAPM
jgi:ankyrin repeat protein